MRNGAKLLLACSVGLLLAGCATLAMRGSDAASALGASPLILRQVQVIGVDSGSSRAVLLRLSRIPDAVRHEAKSRPGRVIIEAAAANAGGDLAERTMPQADAELKGVRVARKKGVLRVTLELARDEPPPYVVREMGDWILIRLGGSAMPSG
ncbi:MAG: AMIN domain-containing protein [candidate division KSB1 bacterium]|nr:AMIN domain-containing protein [candidate division KSB1 bacterium]